MIRPEVEMISQSQNDNPPILVLETEYSAKVDNNLNNSSGTWISLCQPISKWKKVPGERVITVPSKRWHFVTNLHQRYDIPDRGQQ